MNNELTGFYFHTNTNRDGLKGIFSKNTGELPCQSRILIAVDESDKVVAKVSYSTYGNAYQAFQKKFGDQLFEALGKRFGYLILILDSLAIAFLIKNCDRFLLTK